MFNLLPFELFIQILSLLSAKSLLVLCAVCKWLMAVIDDPEFASFHLRHFPDNVLETRFFSIGNINPFVTLDDTVSYTVSSRNRVIYTDHVHNIKLVDWPPKASLDGLVLILGRSRGQDNVVLWNPSIRRHRRLPFLTRSDLEYTLGYHNSCNDYKVVATSEDHNKAWVYSVKSRSWTKNSQIITCNNFGITCNNDSYILAFDDGVAWLKEADSTYNELMSCVWLDFGTERFYRADDLAEIKRALCGLVALDGGSTVGLYGYDVEDHPSIWALQTHTKSWIKRHKIISPMQLREGSIYSRNVVERNGKLVWKSSKIEGAEAASNLFPPINGVYIESLFMLH